MIQSFSGIDLPPAQIFFSGCVDTLSEMISGQVCCNFNSVASSFALNDEEKNDSKFIEAHKPLKPLEA